MTTFDHARMQQHAADLQDAVLGILNQHIGAALSIRAGDIARALSQHGDRTVREAIRQLRRSGHLVLSSVGRNPGYYLAANAQEGREFRDGNLRPRALDILETANAMGKSAGERFGGTAGQMELPL